MKKIITTPNAPAPIGPYNQAVLSNGVLYMSGQIPFDSVTMELVEGDLVKETIQVMENLKAVLEAAEMTFENVVKCSIFLKSMDDFAAVNEVYGKRFLVNPPARETVQVARLPKDVQVEISLIAVK